MGQKTKRDVTAQIWNGPYLGKYAFPREKKGTTGISEVDLVDLGHLEQNLFLRSVPYSPHRLNSARFTVAASSLCVCAGDTDC